MKALNIIMIMWMFLTAGQSLAQENDETKKANARIAQWNVDHKIRVYQAALGINDIVAAKNALLDILVEIPKNDSLLFELGKIYFQLKQYSSSAICAQEVLKSYPGNLGALEMAAISYENIGANDQAATNYELLYLKTDDFQSLYKVALLQFDLERYIESYNNLTILSQRKEADEIQIPSITVNNLQKNYPVKVVILNLMGMIKKENGEIEEAKKLFNEALKIAPDIASVKENLDDLNKK